MRQAIDELDFVRGLGDGTLSPSAFDAYLAQDLLYLSEYARVLARASQLAPTTGEQVFWARSAAGSLAEEAKLHRDRLGRSRAGDDDSGPDSRGVVPPRPSATTLAYLDHLHALAAGTDYAALVAGVLPCFWLYTDLGTRLAANRHPAHPFDDWLAGYADPAFAEATAQAVAIADEAAANASPAVRAAMREAFARSAEHELAFFAQGTL